MSWSKVNSDGTQGVMVGAPAAAAEASPLSPSVSARPPPLHAGPDLVSLSVEVSQASLSFAVIEEESALAPDQPHCMPSVSWS